MVMKMNKTEFIKVLSERLNVDEEYARKINDILEDNFFIGKKNKTKLVNDLIQGQINTNYINNINLLSVRELNKVSSLIKSDNKSTVIIKK